MYIFISDIYIGHLSPFHMEFGHIMENPFGWEERFERKDMKLHRYQGKVNTKLYIDKIALCFSL